MYFPKLIKHAAKVYFWPFLEEFTVKTKPQCKINRLLIIKTEKNYIFPNFFAVKPIYKIQQNIFCPVFLRATALVLTTCKDESIIVPCTQIFAVRGGKLGIDTLYKGRVKKTEESVTFSAIGGGGALSLWLQLKNYPSIMGTRI